MNRARWLRNGTLLLWLAYVASCQAPVTAKNQAAGQPLRGYQSHGVGFLLLPQVGAVFVYPRLLLIVPLITAGGLAAAVAPAVLLVRGEARSELGLALAALIVAGGLALLLLPPRLMEPRFYGYHLWWLSILALGSCLGAWSLVDVEPIPAGPRCWSEALTARSR